MSDILTNSYKLSSVGENKNISASAAYVNSSTDKTAFTQALSSAVNASKPSSTATTMEDIFKRASEKYGVDINLLKAVAKAESNFNTQAVSSCGAKGVMQLMPATCEELGVTDPFDPEQNIMAGAKCLKQKLDEFGDVKIALAAYNAGSGAVRKYNGIPPYSETQNYVKKVMSYVSNSYDLSDKTVSVSNEASDAVSAENGGAANATGTKASDNMSKASLISALSTYAQMSAIMSSSSNNSGVSSLSSSVINNSLNSMLESVISGDGASFTRKDYNSFMQLLALQMQQNILSNFGNSSNSSFGPSNYFNSYSTDYMGSLLTYLDKLSSVTDNEEENVENTEVLKAVQSLNNSAATSNAYTTS